MNKERELLSRALDYLSGLPARTNIQDDIEAYLSTTSDDAEEPVAWGYKDRWGDISDCISCQSAKDAGTKGDFTIPLYLHPPKPAEQEAEPVAWMFQHEDTGLIDYVDTQQVEWGFEKNNPRWQKIGPVYFHPPNPVESEANCYGDGNVYRGVRSKDSEVKTVYVKTAEPARKPWQGLDEDEVEEILEGFPMGTYSEQAFAQAIEQALKEKNT